MAKLTFVEKTAVHDYRLDNILFQVTEADLRTIRCLIDAKTLQDHFGARGRSHQQLMAAFERGIKEIEEAVERQYRALGTHVGQLTLSSRDFETSSALDRQLAKHLRQSTEDSAR